MLAMLAGHCHSTQGWRDWLEVSSGSAQAQTGKQKWCCHAILDFFCNHARVRVQEGGCAQSMQEQMIKNSSAKSCEVSPCMISEKALLPMEMLFGSWPLTATILSFLGLFL